MSATKAQQQRCQISKFQTDDESTMRCAENFAEVETAHPKDSYQVAPCLMLELVYLEQKVLTDIRCDVPALQKFQFNVFHRT